MFIAFKSIVSRGVGSRLTAKSPYSYIYLICLQKKPIRQNAVHGDVYIAESIAVSIPFYIAILIATCQELVQRKYSYTATRIGKI